MARPVKNNASYFPHDSDMRNDPKIKYILSMHGLIGYGVYNCMLEYLTGCEDFETKWDAQTIMLLSGDFRVEKDVFKKIMDDAVEVGLFILQGEVLYSNGLKKRLKEVLENRKRKRERANTRREKQTDSKKVLDVQNSKKVSKTQKKTSEIMQRKEKETKVNKTKEDTNIISNDIINNSNELLENSEKIDSENLGMEPVEVETETPPPTPSQKNGKKKGDGKPKKEITDLMEYIQKKVEDFGFLYRSGRHERNRAQNILTAKGFGELADKYKISRMELLEKILNYSYQHKFWRGKLYNCETFYRYYQDINNDALNEAVKKNGNGGNVTEIPEFTGF